MTVIPEDTLLQILATCLELSSRTLDLIHSAKSSEAAPAEIQSAYAELIRLLHAQKRHDSTLADESWEWIWNVEPDLRPIQIYGRLAWINYTILDLL